MSKKRRSTAAAWLDPGQADLIRAIADAAGLEIRAAGTSQVGRAAEVVAALGGPGGRRGGGKDIRSCDDLRAALASADFEVFLLAAPGDFAAPNPEPSVEDADALALADARERGVHLFTLEPMPGSLLQLDAPSADGAPPAGPTPEWASFCAPMRLSRSIREAAEVIEHLEGVHTATVECWSGVGHGSLGARLYDAVQTIVHFLGVPERIDSAYVSPARARGVGVHAVPGESLRGLDGDITANLRFADGRAATITASSRAGRWNRSLTIIGDNGRLRVYDDGFIWIGRDGKTADSSRPLGGRGRATADAGEPSAHAIAAIADHISRALDPAVPRERPTDVVGVLSAAGAALLSARTGESESPATILRMAGTG